MWSRREMPWTANRAVSFHQELLVMGVGVLGSLRFMIAASKVTLQKGMATHSSVLACRIPWTEEPGGLPSTGSHSVGHGLQTNTSPQQDAAHRDLKSLKQVSNS